ncbi:tyrosine-type recombinase/integrase [Actinomycetospora soli]|uniref:tyrosine-type recombinase/integrase n=1 Tax=Actinomycetospora soli TaxID=2893887 RepID=UPI001E2D3FE3|nr:tyrosine-type recombinase/integrase [Actinomycetospora soli]MCD2191340.1 tyrosine-type recombinase/integrase [Actinomycetospora soli]
MAPVDEDEAGGASELVVPAADGPVARRGELTARAEDLARASRVDSTWTAYTRRWRRFTIWCAEHDEPALPAEPMTIARFLADLAAQWRPATPADPVETIVEGQVLVRAGLRPSTCEGYRAAIAVAHRPAGHDNPCDDERVARVLAGIRRQRGLAPVRRRTALRPAQMRQLLAPLRPEEDLADARDAAMLLIGWKAALRTDDLHRLQLADITVDHDDTGHVGGLAVHLRRSKADQAGNGTTLGITTTDDDLDAITAWRRWTNLLRAHGIIAGPAWRPVDRHGSRPRAAALSTRSIRDTITRRAEAAGLDGDYGGHSLRRGFATTALAGGAAYHAVQQHGRWRSPSSMAPYVEEARRYDDTNPTRLMAG